MWMMNNKCHIKCTVMCGVFVNCLTCEWCANIECIRRATVGNDDTTAIYYPILGGWLTEIGVTMSRTWPSGDDIFNSQIDNRNMCTINGSNPPFEISQFGECSRFSISLSSCSWLVRVSQNGIANRWQNIGNSRLWNTNVIGCNLLHIAVLPNKRNTANRLCPTLSSHDRRLSPSNSCRTIECSRQNASFLSENIHGKPHHRFPSMQVRHIRTHSIRLTRRTVI